MTKNNLTGKNRKIETNLVPNPLTHTVRLLYPFRIEPGCLARATRALARQRYAGRTREFAVWHETECPHDGYREDILPMVTQLLFGIRKGAGLYLRVDSETLNLWFPSNGVLEPKPGLSPSPDRPEPETQASERDLVEQPVYPLNPAGEGIELFLSAHGVGLLSLTFSSGKTNDLEYLQAFTYRLAQLREHTTYWYRIPSEQNCAPPTDDRPTRFEPRLGVPGSTITFEKIVEFLLSPLSAFDLQGMQQQFSVYCITRFDRNTLLLNPQTQAKLKPYLTGLTLIEETNQLGGLQIHDEFLSPRHWTAVGGLGSAHLLADLEPSLPPYDPGLDQCLYHHFVPYLCAYLQRLILQRLVWEADRAILMSGDNPQERQDQLRNLHQAMLAFSAQGHFIDISTREADNQYYEMAQKGLRVPQTLQLVERILHEVDASAQLEFQQLANLDAQTHAKDTIKNLGVIAKLETKLGWLEVFFVSLFATVLIHFVGSDFYPDELDMKDLLATTLLSGSIAFMLIRPDQRQLNEKVANPPAVVNTSVRQGNSQLPWATRLLLAIILIAGFSWFAFGHLSVFDNVNQSKQGVSHARTDHTSNKELKTVPEGTI